MHHIFNYPLSSAFLSFSPTPCRQINLSQAQSDMSLCPPAFKWRLTSIKWNSSSLAWESKPSGSDLYFHTYLPSVTDTHTPGYGYLSLVTTSSISTTWELVRNANSLPQSSPSKSESLFSQAGVILMHTWNQEPLVWTGIFVRIAQMNGPH